MVREIAVDELNSFEEAPEDIYLKLGQLVFEKGEPIPLKVGDTLEETGVRTVFVVPQEEKEEFLFECINTKIDLQTPVLRKEGKLAQSLYRENGELILKAGDLWTKALAMQLHKEKQHVLYLRRSEEKCEQDADKAAQLKEILTALKYRKVKPKSEDPVDNIEDNFEVLEKSYFTANGLDTVANSAADEVTPDEENSMDVHLKRHDPFKFRSAESKERISSIRSECIKDLRYLMEAIAIQESVDSRTMSEISKRSINALIEDRELLISSCFAIDESAREEDFVFSHSVNSAIIAINIAVALKYSAQQIFELSFAAFLHDIGMLKVPKQIVVKKTKLTDIERAEIYKHPTHALDLLQTMPTIPAVTPLVAYQTHERGDRSGYPRRKTLSTINRYARIVAIADIYAAMTASRPYRPPFTPYAVMEYMTREAIQGRVDREILKAFMSTNSLYPVGSWVQLSNNQVGKVIAAHPEKFDKPFVRIFFKDNKRLPELISVDLSQEVDLKVIRSFDGTKLKIDALEGM